MHLSHWDKGSKSKRAPGEVGRIVGDCRVPCMTVGAYIAAGQRRHPRGPSGRDDAQPSIVTEPLMVLVIDEKLVLAEMELETTRRTSIQASTTLEHGGRKMKTDPHDLRTYAGSALTWQRGQASRIAQQPSQNSSSQSAHVCLRIQSVQPIRLPHASHPKTTAALVPAGTSE